MCKWACGQLGCDCDQKWAEILRAGWKKTDFAEHGTFDQPLPVSHQTIDVVLGMQLAILV